jgi:hypothetical protein
MSTKATIAYGPTFHFYNEVFDEDHVYLRLEQVQFEAGSNRVMVPIPVHIWEVIRRYAGIDLSLAEKTDEELLAEVVRAVDERIADYAAAEGQARALVAFSGSLVFDSVEAPRDEQIEAGMRYYREQRERQRRVIAAIDELRQTNCSPSHVSPT